MNTPNTTMDGFKKETKKAGHRYAMQTVVAPFAHKDAVADVQEAFFYGAMSEKTDRDRSVATGKRGLSIDEIIEKAYQEFKADFYGSAEQSKEMQSLIKRDIYEGVKWSITSFWKTLS